MPVIIIVFVVDLDSSVNKLTVCGVSGEVSIRRVTEAVLLSIIIYRTSLIGRHNGHAHRDAKYFTLVPKTKYSTQEPATNFSILYVR
jgi:hypothetical protein